MEKILFLPQCQSTNDEAWAALEAGRAGHGSLVHTGHQTAGRGQRGASWQAEAGQNLLCSTLLYTGGEVTPFALFDLSRAAVLAIAEAITIWTGGLVLPALKWPNDLYVGGAKLGGILIETRWSGNRVDWVVAGLGLNLNQTIFSTGLNATSLRALTDRYWPVDEGAARMQAALAPCLSRLRDPGLLRAQYDSRLLGLNQPSLFREPDGLLYEGVLQGTTAEGLLRVLGPVGERRYDLKEVIQKGAAR